MWFLICISAISLLVYRNTTDFCTLILYPLTLPNSFITYTNYLVEFFRFYVYSIMSCANSKSFISSLPIWMPFFKFCCLIALVRTSSILLNKRYESPHLVPDLRGKALGFPHWVWCVVWDFHVWPLFCGGMFPRTYFVESVFMNGCSTLSNAFSAFIEMIIWFLSSPIDVMYHVDWFVNIEHFCILGMNPTWSLWMIFLYIGFGCLIFCWGFLQLCSSKILAYSSLCVCVCVCGEFIRFWYQNNVGLIELLWMYSFLFYFLE